MPTGEVVLVRHSPDSNMSMNEREVPNNFLMHDPQEMLIFPFSHETSWVYKKPLHGILACQNTHLHYDFLDRKWKRPKAVKQWAWNLMVPLVRLEQTTYWLQISCSTRWAKGATGYILSYFTIFKEGLLVLGFSGPSSEASAMCKPRAWDGSNGNDIPCPFSLA